MRFSHEYVDDKRATHATRKIICPTRAACAEMPNPSVMPEIEYA